MQMLRILLGILQKINIDERSNKYYNISIFEKALTEQVTIQKYPEREAYAESFLYERLVKTTPELYVK